MSDPRHENRHRELTILRKHEESNTMLAIVMAGIAGLFIQHLNRRIAAGERQRDRNPLTTRDQRFRQQRIAAEGGAG